MFLKIQTLVDKGACEDHLDAFRTLCGNAEGIEVTPELCVAYALDFNWDWAAQHLLRASLRDDYWAKSAPLRDDYRAKCAPLDADYRAKCAPLYADYQAKCAPLDADYAAKSARLFGELFNLA